MIIEKKLIKEYKNFNLYGIYKNKKLIYKTCESNIKDKLGNRGGVLKERIENESKRI